jgi:hypothetical protein
MVSVQESHQRAADSFWEQDLSQIESVYLRGRKVTELSVDVPDARVPMGGSIIENFVNTDTFSDNPYTLKVFLQRLRLFVRK